LTLTTVFWIGRLEIEYLGQSEREWNEFKEKQLARLMSNYPSLQIFSMALMSGIEGPVLNNIDPLTGSNRPQELSFPRIAVGNPYGHRTSSGPY
jgi:hypothetical protein